MPEAYIIDAVRTPVGRRGGGLAAVHSADLGAHSIKALVERTGIDPERVDDVVFGCVDTIGPQAGDIARTCWLVAGLPDEVPGTTVDRQCGSSQQAVHFAAQAVMSGTSDLVVAGGDPDTSVHASMAKAKADAAAHEAARVALQCHGAIGYTTEYDLHLYMKRSWALARSWGDTKFHHGRVQRAIL